MIQISEKWLGKNWREVQVYLHEDSTLMWYSGSNPDGGVLLKECPEMIAVGQVSYDGYSENVMKEHFHGHVCTCTPTHTPTHTKLMRLGL